jgi:hypothetical protein
MAIKNIQVLETIKEGRSIYRNSSLSAGGAATAAASINEQDNCLVPHGTQPSKRLNSAQEKTLDRLLAPGGEVMATAAVEIQTKSFERRLGISISESSQKLRHRHSS